jgi:hypothetical protein
MSSEEKDNSHPETGSNKRYGQASALVTCGKLPTE